MRPRACSLLALGLLVMLVATPIGVASAATPNGWTAYNGPGYELYLSPHQQVSASELGLLVNYADEVMTLRVSTANKTVSSVAIAPQTSRFVQLDFPANGTYQVTLSAAGQELLTLTRTRIIPVTPTTPPPWDGDNWQITPPGPNPWDPTPEPTDPLEYTQAAVDALIASITLDILLTTATIMAIMVAVGALVQRAVKFVYPIDIITLSLVGASVALVVLADAGHVDVGDINLWYLLPALVGYLIGYMLGSRNNDWMLQYISPRIGYTYRLPVAVYEQDGRQCIADQNNRALLKRVLFGIHHEIDSEVWLEPNWTDDAKYRLFPAFRRRMINIESMETTSERVPVWWKFSARRYTTHIEVAYGSQATAAELVTSMDVLDRLRSRVQALENENIMLETETPRNVASALVAIMRPSYERTTLERIEEYLSWDEEDDEPEPAPQEVPS